MSFDVDIGHASHKGPRPQNEDFAAALRPAAHEAGRGLIAAIADGVSAGGHGRVAAQTAVMSLVNDFHAVPATWETTVALDRLIGAHNAWLVDHNRRRSGDASGLSTLTALALRGHTWTVAHVGDTRAWLLRGGECTQLTHDHAFDHPDLRSQLTRAIGLDDSLRIDFHQGELQVGDTLLLSSDGVHQVLKRAAMREVLAGSATAQEASERLVEAALAAGGHDNATALVIRVRGLDAGSLDDALLQGRQLPMPPRLKVGDTLDGYVVTALVANTGVHRLVQARDSATRALVAIKMLHESRAGDPEERAMLAHEAWLGRTVTERDGQGFVRVREPRDPSAFYAVFDWHGGSTLEQLLAAGQRFTVDEVVQGTLAAARALGRLHRQRVVHRDVKPANLHFGDDGQWRLLDLGVAVSGREPASVRSLHAGTPSYMNPEQWEEGHGGADAASDLYALGVTLYRWLTGRLPYGEIEPFQIARYRRDPVAPSRLRPELPIWLDHVVLKAVARGRQQRFETAEEFVLALERGASRPLGAPPATPLVTRDPSALWKIACAISLLFNVLLVIWLLFLPR
ncbi:protein kinase domain-containing protein [Methylibium sp.]|uniref:protein kinase domain-containing protein n=1 Tax=Methylibium sp. TaxID=2067992 RepID=UPI003D14CC5A